MRHVPSFSDFLSTLRRPAPSTPCAWCVDAPAGSRTATAEHVAVAMPGALRVDDMLCDGCADALDADVVREVVS